MGVAVSPSGSRVYVANQVDNTVSVIDTSTNTVVATVPVGAAPFSSPVSVAVNPTGVLVYVTNAGEDTVSVIYAPTNRVIANVAVGRSPFGLAVDPTGTRVFVGNDMGASVSVIDAATNTIAATVAVGEHPEAFGAFVAGAPAAGGACSTELDKLRQQLADANAALSDLWKKNAALNTQITGLQQQVADLKKLNAALTADNVTLKSDLNAANLLLASFVSRLFGGRTDANVAAAARDAAQHELALAIAKVGARDRRVRQAQEQLNDGLAALAHGYFQRAVNEFREAFEIAEHIIRR
jgi:YVTN family beta-propeller protein